MIGRARIWPLLIMIDVAPDLKVENVIAGWHA